MDINKILKSKLGNDYSGGYSCLVYKDGKEIINIHDGYRHNFNGIKKEMHDDTWFDIASNTKIYSGIFLMQYLMSTGKYEITLDTKISDVLSNGYYDSSKMKIINTAAYSKTGPLVGKKITLDGATIEQDLREEITIGMLLNHTSGYDSEVLGFSKRLYESISPNILTDEIKMPYESISSNTRSETLLKIVENYPIINKPGTTWVYSDTNYMLLCILIETITKRPIEDLLYQVCKDMNINIKYNGCGHENVASTELNGSERTNHFDSSPELRSGVLTNTVDDEKCHYLMEGVSCHAGLFANKYNLMKILEVLRTGKYNEREIIKPSVLEDFRIPLEINPSQSNGFFKNDSNKNLRWSKLFGDKPSLNSYGHSGWTGIFSMYDVENDISIVWLTNKKHSRFININKNECVDDKSILGDYPRVIDYIYELIK